MSYIVHTICPVSPVLLVIKLFVVHYLVLKEAMEKGYVYVMLVKVIVEGPAGVGKTSLLYLLLGKAPPEERNSTGCAERALRVIRVGKEGGEWSEISTKEFQEMIAEAVPILCEELKTRGKGVNEVVKVLSDLEGMDVEGEEGDGSDGREGGDGRGRKKLKLTESSASAEDSKAVIDGVIQKLTKLVSDRSSRRLLDMELIYLTDCGGQQAFWDLAPIFTYDTSATLFVHRLCEKLDEHPLNDLYQSGRKVGPSQRASLTTAEAFKTMLRGLHEGEKRGSREGEKQDEQEENMEEGETERKHRSKIIAVGTHKDLVDECEETPEDKSKKLAAIASPHFKDDVVYRNESLAEIVFQVDTKSPKDDDKKEARKIRASIEKGARHHKIPIWWFILQMILEALSLRLGRQVLSKKECVHVSSTLGFSEEELDAALAFFDKLNIFLYKRSILPGVVFTNAQVPLDKLSKLVEKQYHLKAAEADPTIAADRAMTGDWKKFRDNGILTVDILKEFQDHYVDGVFAMKDFLTLLEKLLVVSKLSPTKYFFPAILEMTDECKIRECLISSSSSKIAALVVQFPTGWAPPGVYCCSVCHLQSIAHWEVVNRSQTTHVSREKQLPHFSRNCITFTKRGRPGSVSFIDNFSFFAVRVNMDTSSVEQKELNDYCQAIKQEVFAAVEAGLKNTHHTNSHPTTAFLCPHHNKACTAELHTAHISDNGKRWICSENSEVFDLMTPHQSVWLTGPGKTGCMHV